MKTLYETLDGTYREENGHLVPELELPEQTNYQIGKYGQFYLDYIKNHSCGGYTTLLTEGKLNSRLHEIDLEAKELLETIITRLAADYVISVKGDSMEPNYHDGDKVFVEKCDAIEIGEVGIFVVNGDAYIKELGNECLISNNPAYKPIKLGSSDSIYCCGRVLGVVEE